MLPSSPLRLSLARLLAALPLAFAPLAPAAVLLAPSAALAEPSSADKETARNLMKEGDAKFAAKDFAGALKAYQAAHAIMQVPSTGLPLARTQIERGLLVEARDTLLQVSRHPQAANEPAAYAKAREEAAQLAGKLAPRIPSLVIAIEGPSADAAAVAVDGSAVPTAALGAPRKVNPGSHTVTASASGFRDASATVEVKEGENEKVTLKLVATGGAAQAGPTPGPSAPIKGGGRLRIESPTEPGNVFVDGKASGVTPLDIAVAPGAHKIEIEYPGGTHEEQRTTVDAGKTEVVSFQPSPMDTVARHRKWVHIGMVAGPSMAAYLDGGPPLFGGTVGFVLNVGITPTFDFRTGVTATVVKQFNGDHTQMTAVVPAMLRVNWSPWFSSAAGLSGGFILDYDSDPDDPTQLGVSIGPEWTVLSLAAGDKRQYELAFTQGLRFGHAPKDFHQSVVFTYLSLD